MKKIVASPEQAVTPQEVIALAVIALAEMDIAVAPNVRAMD